MFRRACLHVTMNDHFGVQIFQTPRNVTDNLTNRDWLKWVINVVTHIPFPISDHFS